jgi:glycosyltransferase involved in cell wall biosynthesis
MKKIYTNHYYHPQKRNVLVANDLYEVYIEKDFFNVIYHLYFKLFKRALRDTYKNLHFTFFRKRNHHFFNTISLNSKNWIVTFSTTIPRGFENSKRIEAFLVKRLAHKSCKKIIANSLNAVLIETDFLTKNYPKYKDVILNKIEVISPPQEKLIHEYLEKPLNKIRFIIVGHEFFRKGGLEILRAFDKLIEEGLNIELIIVSRLDYNDYATKYGKAEYEEAYVLIEKNKKSVVHHLALPNKDVLELIKTSHVGLLPTWAEAYGYSVLEFQALGVPVITTDVRAMPEINNEVVGWIIKVPKDELGRAKRYSEEDRKELSTIIEQGIIKSIKEILINKETIAQKGINALKKVDETNNKDIFVKRMNSNYCKEEI